MIRLPINKTAAKELAERAGLIVLDPDSDADASRLAQVLWRSDDMAQRHSARDVLRDLAGDES